MIKIRMKTPSLDQTEGRREGNQAKKLSHQKNQQIRSSSPQVLQKVHLDLNQHLQARNDNVTPVREARDDDECQWNSSSSPTLDREWHKTKTIKLDNLTQEVLTGLTYDLIKGTCKSVVELEYHLEENDQGRQVIPLDHFINNDLEYLKGGSLIKKYTTSITKTKAVDYGQVRWIKDKDDKLYKFREGDFKRHHKQDIEDILLLLVQDKLTNLNLEEGYALNVALRMFTRRIVIQECMEDLQLGVESYQKKINLKRPDTYHSDLKRMTAYTAYPNIQGIIYEDEMNRKRLMRADELHKFSDGTLNYVRTALNDIG
ncbi:hypothetical protein Tco_0931923 [Tanacetum coccineum]